MSDIKEMNVTIRRRSAGWAAFATVITAGGISPQAIVEATHGDPTGNLAWGSLVAIFAAVELLLEAFDIGRSTQHRSKVDKNITELVIRESCSNEHCPQASNPSDKARSVALNTFYKLIDKPSREVAFHQWAWYYTSLHWIAFSVLGFVMVLASWPLVPTDFPVLRGFSMLVLICMLLIASCTRKVWARKTLTRSSAQVQQIASQLTGAVRQIGCTDESCPLR